MPPDQIRLARQYSILIGLSVSAVLWSCYRISRNDKYQPFCFSIHHPDGVTRSTRICHHTDVERKRFGEFIFFPHTIVTSGWFKHSRILSCMIL